MATLLEQASSIIGWEIFLQENWQLAKFLVCLIFVLLLVVTESKYDELNKYLNQLAKQSHCSYKPTQLKYHVHVANFKNYSLLLFVVNIFIVV